MEPSSLDSSSSATVVNTLCTPWPSAAVTIPTDATTWTVDMGFLETATPISTATPSNGPTHDSSSSSSSKDNTGKPLHSLAVQLILGGLGMCLFIATVVRCYNISWRNHEILMRARRMQDIEAQRQRRSGRTTYPPPSPPSSSSSLPPHYSGSRAQTHQHHHQHHHNQQQQQPRRAMAETGAGEGMAGRSTLAARLRMYREMAMLTHGRVGVRPPENGIGTRLTELEDSLPQSYVAPAYHEDVSPPSFLATVGKPPSYEEAVPTDQLSPTAASPTTPQPLVQSQDPDQAETMTEHHRRAS